MNITPEFDQRLRQCAALFLEQEPECPKSGYVEIYVGKAVGWMSALHDPGRYAPEMYAVPGDGSAIYKTTGGDTNTGAAKWICLGKETGNPPMNFANTPLPEGVREAWFFASAESDGYVSRLIRGEDILKTIAEMCFSRAQDAEPKSMAGYARILADDEEWMHRNGQCIRFTLRKGAGKICFDLVSDSLDIYRLSTFEALQNLMFHVRAMHDDAYLTGHPEWVELHNEAKKIDLLPKP